jgi:hypothetical protein
MLEFYGFAMKDGAIVPSANFEASARNWLTPANHNHLRLTRMIRSLRVLGLEAEGIALWQALDAIYATDAGREAVSERTYKFWTRAGTAGTLRE